MDKVLVIAEAGVNHNGNIEIAKELCYAAKEAEADVVKFQTWITDRIITRKVRQADYQEKNTGNNESQYEMLKKLELTHDAFRKIKEYCDQIEIQFASTADEEESLDFLVDLGIPFIKIGSGDVGNISYLRYIGSKKLPIVLSTGMSTLEDVRLSLEALREGGAEKISLLHCTTSYPCPYENVNLRAMDTLKETFSLPVGYSDHTNGIAIPIAAVARGARIIEKHFTLDKNMEGPDHIASTEPKDFKEMVKFIRNVETALGKGEKEPTAAEKEISKVVLKKIVAQKEISCGKIIEPDDICVKRSENGMAASLWDEVIGTKAKRNYNVDDGIEL